MGQLNVYHAVDSFLPTRGAEYWIVHDELSGIQKDLLFQKTTNAAKFLANDLAIDGVSGVASGAAGGVAALFIATAITDGVVGSLDTRTNDIKNDLSSLSSYSY